MQAKQCKDCKYSVKPENSWCLYCTNPILNSNNRWFLAAAEDSNWSTGIECIVYRKPGFFQKCGLKGKLWEPKIIEEK